MAAGWQTLLNSAGKPRTWGESTAHLKPTFPLPGGCATGQEKQMRLWCHSKISQHLCQLTGEDRNAKTMLNFNITLLNTTLKEFLATQSTRWKFGRLPKAFSTLFSAPVSKGNDLATVKRWLSLYPLKVSQAVLLID